MQASKHPADARPVGSQGRHSGPKVEPPRTALLSFVQDGGERPQNSNSGIVLLSALSQERQMPFRTGKSETDKQI